MVASTPDKPDKKKDSPSISEELSEELGKLVDRASKAGERTVREAARQGFSILDAFLGAAEEDDDSKKKKKRKKK